MNLEKLREIAKARTKGEFFVHYSTLAVQAGDEATEPTVADGDAVTIAMHHIDALLDVAEAASALRVAEDTREQMKAQNDLDSALNRLEGI